MLAHAFIFGGQYTTISQIARLLTAFYLAYIGTNDDLLPESMRKICKFASLVYFGIVLAVAIINSTELIRP